MSRWAGKEGARVHREPTEPITDELVSRLCEAGKLDAFLSEDEAFVTLPAFSEYVTELCRQKGMVPERVIKAAQIERTYGHQLFNGRRSPSRDKVIQLAVGFGLTVEETQELLVIARCARLCSGIRRDVVLACGLASHKTMDEVQELLEEYGFSLLGEGT